MDSIVLVKQVPDIANIPPEAWDKEKGTLRRAALDAVVDPLGLHALTLANRMRAWCPESRIVALTMGPPEAESVLADALARCADEAVLLTDRAFAGSDTIATSYALAQAIRHIRAEFLRSDDFVIFAGVQSVDGDTAQVPPQIAEELGLEHIAYVRDIRFGDGPIFERIGPDGIERVRPTSYPVLATATACTDPAYRSFRRALRGGRARTWDAAHVEADPRRVGMTGSKTRVTRIFSPEEQSRRHCVYPRDARALVDLLETKYAQEPPGGRLAPEQASYRLDGIHPSYSGDVWVFVERHSGGIRPVSLELLGKARELADSIGAEVGAVVVGNDGGGLAPQLIGRGADTVYVLESSSLEIFRPLPWSLAVADLVARFRPQILLVGASPLGRELAPRIAYRTRCGLTADCTKLAIVDSVVGKRKLTAVLEQTRPALGGNIMATILTKDSPTQMATVRPGVMAARRPDPARRGRVFLHTPDVGPQHIKTEIRVTGGAVPSAPLSRARIVVAGGRGLESKGAFDEYLGSLAAQLEDRLGDRAELGGTRMAIDDGFLPRDRQIGQTGQTIRPRLYVAVGISGAVQHVSGMSNSQIVVAVNKDANAPIFRDADIGMVGDFREVIPRIVEALNGRAGRAKASRPIAELAETRPAA